MKVESNENKCELFKFSIYRKIKANIIGPVSQYINFLPNRIIFFTEI